MEQTPARQERHTHVKEISAAIVGSGNIGTANVVRAGGVSADVITLVGDALKGAIPVIVARVRASNPH